MAANKFKKPVRLILTRKEDISITGQRHESLVDYKVLADKSTGKICSAKFKAYCNGGISTGKSLSKTLILPSIDPRYDKKFDGHLQNWICFAQNSGFKSPHDKVNFFALFLFIFKFSIIN